MRLTHSFARSLPCVDDCHQLRIADIRQTTNTNTTTDNNTNHHLFHNDNNNDNSSMAHSNSTTGKCSSQDHDSRHLAPIGNHE